MHDLISCGADIHHMRRVCGLRRLSLTLLIASIAVITIVLSRHEAVTPHPADSQAVTTTGARLLSATPALTGWQQQ